VPLITFAHGTACAERITGLLQSAGVTTLISWGQPQHDHAHAARLAVTGGD
jgi:hypothetical protein